MLKENNKIIKIKTKPNLKPQNTTKKIKKKITSLPNPSKNYGNPLNKMYKNPGLAQQFRAAKLAEYYIGATYPKYAVEQGLDVKLPTDLPIPSACIRVSKSVQLTQTATGYMFVNYVPGSLLVSNHGQGDISSLSCNVTCDGNGTAGANAFMLFSPVNVPQVYDRWRLTAAEATLKYNGKVLDQSGTMYSCVHYELPVAAIKGTSGTGAITGQNNINVDRISTDFSLVRMGLWNEQISLSQTGQGITHIWSPTTSNDFSFPGLVGTTATSSGSLLGPNLIVITAASNATVSSSGTQNATRNFCWALENLPINENCLMFEVHEVYEYIPDIGSVGVIKAVDDAPSTTEYDQMKSIPRQNVTVELKQPKKGFFSHVQNVLSKITDNIDIPKILGFIAKAIL